MAAGFFLPSFVAVSQTRSDLLEEALTDQEACAVQNAVPKRKREFHTGRSCARRALRQLGFVACSIPVGTGGEPLWPKGVVGSITHCDGYAACAVAWAHDAHAIGIDAEPNQALPKGVLKRIALPEESSHLRQLANRVSHIHWDRLLFCIKEATYKVWYPLTTAWLGFDDVQVHIDPERLSFSVKFLVPGFAVEQMEVTHLYGRWQLQGDILLVAIVLS